MVISRAKQLLQVKHWQLLVSLVGRLVLAGTAALAFQQSLASLVNTMPEGTFQLVLLAKPQLLLFNSGSVIPFSSGSPSGGSSLGSLLKGLVYTPNS